MAASKEDDGGSVDNSSNSTDDDDKYINVNVSCVGCSIYAFVLFLNVEMLIYLFWDSCHLRITIKTEGSRYKGLVSVKKVILRGIEK